MSDHRSGLAYEEVIRASVTNTFDQLTEYRRRRNRALFGTRPQLLCRLFLIGCMLPYKASTTG